MREAERRRKKEISPYIEFVPSCEFSSSTNMMMMMTNTQQKIRVEKLPSIKNIKREMERCLMETNKTFAAASFVLCSGGRAKKKGGKFVEGEWKR